jgi:p-methyltransferase
VNSPEEFGLTGMGNSWSHRTMSYDQAAAIKIEMFRQIKNAVSVDPDTSLWYLAYLYDQGHDFQRIKTMQQGINAVMADQLNGSMGLDTEAWRQFAVAVSGNGP